MIVIDANSIVKLALEEPYSKETREFIRGALNGEDNIATVDIALAEALNAVWKHNLVIKDLSDQKAELAGTEIMEFWEDINKVPSQLIADKARRIAKTHKLTVYDSLYVAAAIKHDSILLTFDRAIKENVARLGVELVKL